ERHADLIRSLRELPTGAADAALREHYIRSDGARVGHE
ncbi:MAG: hypothetical protein JWP39_3346, partial [Jatrophihabitans sp.]|nr:hypothetical protein [Jatrophihabitans sp.]